MAKTPDPNVKLAQEDADALAARNRSDTHQAALAAESKEQRSAQAKASVGAPEALVMVTITKFGDGKVSTGEHVAVDGDVKAKKGDVIEVSPAIAKELEARGFAEAV